MGDSMVIIGVIGNFVIRLDETTGLWQIHLGRALLMLPLIACLFLLGLGSLKPNRYGRVVLRSVMISLAMLFLYKCVGTDADRTGSGRAVHLVDYCAADFGSVSKPAHRTVEVCAGSVGLCRNSWRAAAEPAVLR